MHKIYKAVGTVFLFLALALLLFVGCQPVISSPSNTKISNGDGTAAETTIQAHTPLVESRKTVTSIDVARLPSPTPVTDFISGNPTSQPAAIKTPTLSIPTVVTTVPANVLEFDTQIAFLGQYQENNNYLIGVFDVVANTLHMVADDENIEFGAPMWNPEKNKLAFTVSNKTTVSLQISDLTNSTQVFLDKAFEQSSNEGTPFLFGWSAGAEWLAYAFIYPTTEQDLYLINVQTEENILIDNSNSTWFAWSPYNGAFVFTDSSILYVGDVEAPNDLESYQGKGYIGLISWHPSKNTLLVGISDNIAGDLNQLWELNLDSGEWSLIGEYPELTHFEYAPNGKSIAIHLQDRMQELNRLLVIDVETASLMYEVELPDNPFFKLKWIDDETIGLTARDDIYVVPVKTPSLSYWVLDNEELVKNHTFLIHAINW